MLLFCLRKSQKASFGTHPYNCPFLILKYKFDSTLGKLISLMKHDCLYIAIFIRYISPGHIHSVPKAKYRP